MTPKLIIFDFDGVLVDTQQDTDKLQWQYLMKDGLDMTFEKFTEKFSGYAGVSIVKNLVQNKNINISQSIKSYVKDMGAVVLAQHYNILQDTAAIKALKRLAELYLSEKIDWHIVIYTFMGIFPETIKGHQKILEESVHLAQLSGAKRLIVKTHEESFQIPSVKSNLKALKTAYDCTQGSVPILDDDHEEEEIIFSQSKAIIECVLNLDPALDIGFLKAFKAGYLDVPFCLHQDNLRAATCEIDSKGYLQWISTGKLPIKIKKKQDGLKQNLLSSQKFIKMLAYNRVKFDF